MAVLCFYWVVQKVFCLTINKKNIFSALTLLNNIYHILFNYLLSFFSNFISLNCQIILSFSPKHCLIFQGIENLRFFKGCNNSNLKVQYIVNTMAESKLFSHCNNYLVPKKHSVQHYPDGLLHIISSLILNLFC